MEITATHAVDHSVELNLSESVSVWGDGEDGHDWDQSIHIMSAVTYSLLCVLGVLGNGVVIWATGFRMKKTVSTVWYLNLAVADFLATAFLPLQITQRALGGRWPFGPFMCATDRVVFYVNMYASIFTLALISADRCACVVRPVWTRNHRTVRKASWVSAGVWVLALAANIPGFVFKDDARPAHGGEVRCYSNYAFLADWSGRTPEETRSHAFRLAVKTVTRFLVGFAVPFAVVVSCYSVVVHRLRNNRSLAGRSGRSSKIAATVVTAFFLCWAPFHVVQLIRFVHFPVPAAYTPTGLAVKFGVPVAAALALLNSCLNPLLYAFSGRGFKDVFRRSVLEVLEKAFAEEPIQNSNISTDPAASRPQTALSETLV